MAVVEPGMMVIGPFTPAMPNSSDANSEAVACAINRELKGHVCEKYAGRHSKAKFGRAMPPTCGETHPKHARASDTT